jgi:hypothetical protein
VDGAYAIGMTNGIWIARRCDGPTRILTADTAPELRWLLWADHGHGTFGVSGPFRPAPLDTARDDQRGL